MLFRASDNETHKTNMHGILLESIADCIRETWGEGIWATLVRQAGIGWGGFSTHKVYSEDVIKRISQTLVKIVNVSEDEVMFQLGAHFMTFVAGYGYDQVTKVLGRKLCDFINGLDNLHDYISNLYKEIRPPSFYVEEEDDLGLTFHYNTPRTYLKFIQYVRGMVTVAARIYYNMADFSVVVMKEESVDGGMHGVFRVTYTNSTLGVQGPWMPALRKLREQTPVTVNSDIVFNAFPFSIIFSESMRVLTCGAGVVKSFPTLVGKKITDFFVLTKPFGIPFTWEYMSSRPVNVLVEMTSTVALSVEYEEYLRSQDKSSICEIPDPDDAIPPSTRGGLPPLKLRGTIAYLDGWNAAIFMCTPVFDSLETMKDIGLYISDLSFQDSVQVLLVAGPQQSAELKIALDMEQTKNSKLEETLGELDKENKKTDELLFSMIPREIAERLKKGESTLNIAETFAEVTVLFSDVVGFTNICSRITPMEVVAILNQIYTVFDTLSERYEVYKVETIGDGYMAVSGAPKRTKLHAQQICDMALEMQAGIRHLKDPWTGSSIRIRIGIHSGGVVAGVVGQKMIRYCLFGDTVNTASRMESSGEGCEIHISKTVRDRLVVSGAYIIEDRGMIYVKGKGQMRTYWLKGRKAIQDKDTLGNSETVDIGTPTDCNTGAKKQSDSDKSRSANDATADLQAMSMAKHLASARTSECNSGLLSNQTSIFSSVFSGTERNRLETQSRHYPDHNTMSFRKALEEIADLQTKEMVAYHGEKNVSTGVTEGPLWKEKLDHDSSSSVDISNNSPRDLNVDTFRASIDGASSAATSEQKSLGSAGYISTKANHGSDMPTPLQPRKETLDTYENPVASSDSASPVNNMTPSNRVQKKQVRDPQSVAAKARSAVSILSACNYETNISAIAMSLTAERQNGKSRDASAEMNPGKIKKRSSRSKPDNNFLPRSSHRSFKKKSAIEPVDRKDGAGRSLEVDNGSVNYKMRRSKPKPSRAQEPNEANRSGFCVIC